MTLYRDVYGKAHERSEGAPVTWRVSGYGVVVRDGRLLMIEPIMEADWTWGLPGGGIEREPEETILAGIAREVYEETGYRFAPDPATLVFNGEARYLTLRGRHLRSLLFTASGETSETPDPAWQRPDGEVARVEWIEIASLQPHTVQWFHWETLVRLGIVPSAS